MFTFMVLMLGSWLLMAAAPDTPAARLLRHWTVERPADWLIRVSPLRLWGSVAAMIMVGVLIWLEAGDALKIIGMMAPELLAWATMFEIGILVDALAATAMIWSGRQAASVKAWVQVASRRLFATRTRARRRRRVTRSPSPPANDDEPDRTIAA